MRANTSIVSLESEHNLGTKRVPEVVFVFVYSAQKPCFRIEIELLIHESGLQMRRLYL